MWHPDTFFNWSLPNRSTSFKQVLTHVIAKVLQKGDLKDVVLLQKTSLNLVITINQPYLLVE